MSHVAPTNVVVTSRTVQRFATPQWLTRFWPVDKPGNHRHRWLPATHTAAFSGDSR